MVTLPRLVLLPGMDGSGTLFEPLLAQLGPDLPTTVVRYPPDQPLGYVELEALVRAVLPKRGPYFLLGESFSGPIALSLAAQQPGGLQGLLLCCTFARNPYPSLAIAQALLPFLRFGHPPLWLLETLLLGKDRRPALSQALNQALAPLTDRTMKARLSAVLSVSPPPRLDHIQIPSLYLQAQSDRVVPARAYDALLGLLPNLHKASLAGPHCLLQTQPAAAAQVIRNFIKQHTRLR